MGKYFMYKGALGACVLCERHIGVIQFPSHCNYFCFAAYLVTGCQHFGKVCL